MRAAATAAASATVALVVFGLLVPHGFLNGDAPVYAERIATRSLGNGSVHLGYYLAGLFFTRLLPIDPPLALTMMSAIAAALCVGLVVTISYTTTGRVSAGIAAAATLVALPVFAENAVFAEIYIVQLLFFLLCVQLVLWEWPVAAGLAFGCAFLVTPSSIFAAPFVVLLAGDRRSAMRGAAAGALLAAVAILPNYRDYLWGGIGVLHLQAADVSALTALPKEARELGGLRALPLAALAGIGLWTLAISSKRRVMAIGIGVLWTLTWIAGERYSDVPVQLPFYAMMSVACGVGVARLLHATKGRQALAASISVAALLALLLPASIAYPSVRNRSVMVDAFRGEIRTMAQQAKAGDVVIAKWPTDRIARYYLDVGPRMEWIDYAALLDLTGVQAQTEAMARLDAALAYKRRLWLIDTPQAGGYLESRGYSVAQQSRFVFLATPDR